MDWMNTAFGGPLVGGFVKLHGLNPAPLRDGVNHQHERREPLRHHRRTGLFVLGEEALERAEDPVGEIHEHVRLDAAGARSLHATRLG